MRSFQCLAVSFFGLTMVSTSSSQDKAKYYRIVNENSGKVLAIEDNSKEAGRKSVQTEQKDHHGQQWQLVQVGEYVKLVNRHSGKALDSARPKQGGRRPDRSMGRQRPGKPAMARFQSARP